MSTARWEPFGGGVHGDDSSVSWSCAMPTAMPPERPSTPTNPDLIAALERLEQGDSADSRASVYAAALEALFLVPLRNERDPTAEPGTPLRVVVIHGDFGEELLVFTDWDAAWKWPGNERAPSFAVMTGPRVFQMAHKLDIALVLINAWGPIGLRVNKAAIAM